MNATQQELDSLGRLEERITRAVELVSGLRAEKEALEGRLATALADRDAFSQELEDLRAERKQVRARIEKLLGQVDLLSGA